MISDVTSKSAYQDTYASDQLAARQHWPELIFESEHLHYPARLNCVQELLNHPQLHDKPVFYTETEVWSYARLQQTVNRIANYLVQDLGLQTGNRVLLRAANCPMMAASLLAVMKAGLIAVPSMPMLRAHELSYMLEKVAVNAVLCCVSLQAELHSALELSSTSAQSKNQPKIQPKITYFNDHEATSLESLSARHSIDFEAIDTSAEDICLISFTSGSTGTAKASAHFHRDLLAICDCFPRSILNTTENDRFIGTPPFAFSFGLGGLLLFPLRAGASVVLHEKYTAQSLLQAIEDFKVSICFTAPTLYQRMLAFLPQFTLSHLSRVVSAGEPLPLATRTAWEQASGIKMIDGIGCTEMLHIFISAAGDEIRPGATGKVIPGYQACILDTNGALVEPGVIGQLAVKGPTGCRYLSDQRQLNYVKNGWNLTGDAYLMDADGYFWYQARVDDMIISAGYNIAGPEVEAALMQHPAVLESAVIGLPDTQRGHIVKAFVVLKDGFEASQSSSIEIQNFVKATIAPYKYPREIEFVSELPRTESGKLQRFKLRSALKAQLQDLPATSVSNPEASLSAHSNTSTKHTQSKVLANFTA